MGKLTPTSPDVAQSLISGSFAAAGPSAPFVLDGKNQGGFFNAALWGTKATTVTTTSGSVTATVASATGLAVGQTIQSANIPAGTTIAGLSGTTVTLSAAATADGAGTAFTAVGAAFAAVIQLERSFDGGATYIAAGIDANGNPASYTDTNISLTVKDSERNVLYRWNCITYTSGTPNYRISL